MIGPIAIEWWDGPDYQSIKNGRTVLGVSAYPDIVTVQISQPQLRKTWTTDSKPGQGSQQRACSSVFWPSLDAGGSLLDGFHLFTRIESSRGLVLARCRQRWLE
jgi:hypothetical protein